MAKHGVLHNVDAQFVSQCINRAGKASIDLDGGALVEIGAVATTDNEVYTLTAPTASTKRYGIVYNPAVKYDKIGELKFPARSLDDRNYYNFANDVVDFWIPEVNVGFGIMGANIEGSTMPTVGQFLKPTASKTTFTVSTTAPTSGAYWEVMEIREVSYPTGKFTDDKEKVYVVETRSI